MEIEEFQKGCEKRNQQQRIQSFEAIHNELFQFHHKRKYFKSLDEELAPIAWHPDRYWDWCLDEEERKEIEKLW